MRRSLPILLLLAPTALGAEIACPATLGSEAPSGFIRVAQPSPTGFPFRGIERQGPRPLAGISVVDGPASDILAEAPGTLIPDEGASGHPRPPLLRQRWNIAAGSPRGFLLVCHYVGTAAVLFRALPPGLRECIQTLPVDVRGNIAESGPRSGGCR